MYEKTDIKPHKHYYCPILPTLINAYARCYMYDQYKKFDLKDLIYTATDSILFNGKCKVPINNGLGGFKWVSQDEDMLLYGKNTYLIGNEIKAGGLPKSLLTKEGFLEGNVEVNLMQGMTNTLDINEVGKFKLEKRDLKDIKEKYTKLIGVLESENLYKDCNFPDLSVLKSGDIESI